MADGRPERTLRLVFDNSPNKLKATRAYIAMSILFFVFTVGIGFVIAANKGYGAGPWDSHTVWSCYTPGGPYYLKDRPISRQPCPSPYSTAIDSHGRLPAKDAPPHPK
jgi:hypothetical protein